MNLSFGTLATAEWSTSPDVTEYLELGHHDPSGRGFTVQSAEIALDGAVDPYFRGFGNICFGLDADGETHVGLEEAYSLMARLLTAWAIAVAGGALGAGASYRLDLPTGGAIVCVLGVLVPICSVIGRVRSFNRGAVESACLPPVRNSDRLHSAVSNKAISRTHENPF